MIEQLNDNNTLDQVSCHLIDVSLVHALLLHLSPSSFHSSWLCHRHSLLYFQNQCNRGQTRPKKTPDDVAQALLVSMAISC